MLANVYICLSDTGLMSIFVYQTLLFPYTLKNLEMQDAGKPEGGGKAVEWKEEIEA